MQINPIRACKVSFNALPERNYPYELPKGEFEGQAESQMPKIRVELTKYEKSLEAQRALCNLQHAMDDAMPYMMPYSEKTKSAVELMNNRIDAGFAKYNVSQMSQERLEQLLLCFSQSKYQQDKHDAVWLFNRLSPLENFDKLRGTYAMADVFRNLDRTYDKDEIAEAETTLRRIYRNELPGARAVINERFGYGKNLDFKA